MDQEKKGTKGEDEKKTKVRITITCRNVASIEKVSNQIIYNAKQKEKDGATFRGPMRMPVKTLRITTRKSPCGEGSKTWDRYEMRIYKRVIDLTCYQPDIKEITSMNIDSGVEIELVMTQD